MRGIVFDGKDHQLTDDVSVRDIHADEVRVKIEAAGLCHSDVSVIDGTIPFPPPVVLGHEGAGIIQQVGDSVSGLEVGDHVILSTLGNCGHCPACDKGKPTYCRTTYGRLDKPFTVGGEPHFQFANTSVFVEETVVKGSSAIKVDNDLPFDIASLVGCGVITGVGAVINRAQVSHGESVAVLGVGGIGLNVIQGARLADALPIIAIDTNPAKEEIAREFGATHFIQAGEGVDTIAAVKEICPDGVDYSFECVGVPALIRQSVDMLDWGGSAVILGVPKLGTEASFMVAGVYNDKSIMGCRYGAGRPHHDFPMLVDLYKAGRLMLDELVTRTYPIADYETALDDLHKGELARGVLTF